MQGQGDRVLTNALAIHRVRAGEEGVPFGEHDPILVVVAVENKAADLFLLVAGDCNGVGAGDEAFDRLLLARVAMYEISWGLSSSRLSADKLRQTCRFLMTEAYRL